MTADEQHALVAAAVHACDRAIAPYSRFHVGAALRTRSGKIITGANVESASYRLTCCAERVALFKALTEGEREFTAIAVAARKDGGATPCGACRQLLAEYAPAATVLVVDTAQPAAVRQFTLPELLPAAFISVPRGA